MGAPVAPLRQSVVLDRNHLARTGIMMPWTDTARVVEEFRIVKRNIMLPWQSPDYPRAANRPPRVIMVTSSRPREGKTFCSINLALAFAAEENLTTILLDADALHGGIAKLLQLPAQPGFTDLLTRERRLEEVLIQTDLPNLVVLPPGPPGPHVPELLHGKGPGLVFKEIARRYPEHVIVMDTTPCLASTDPAGFAPLSQPYRVRCRGGAYTADRGRVLAQPSRRWRAGQLSPEQGAGRFERAFRLVFVLLR